MHTYNAIAYVRLKPATRRYDARSDTLKPRIARQYCGPSLSQFTSKVRSVILRRRRTASILDQGVAHNVLLREVRRVETETPSSF